MKCRHFVLAAMVVAMLGLTLTAMAKEKAKKPAEAPAAPAAASDDAWLTSWDKAVEQAKSTGKPILADFTGSDWCSFCVKLKKEVLNQEDFKAWAAKNVILLELDFPKRKAQDPEIKKQNAELKKKFNIEGFPTVVVISAKGKEADRIVGYNGKQAWEDQLKGIMAKAK